ncbi:alpha/beta hydrolase family protein [Chryseobacterium sp.]|uniref:alpha/beta hydrolase family protein n=1 Tax=Chryseobacterium sp. TaxID=1871047 RepID=UPI0011C7BDE3|nr:prolyl oligopeptidase family serine peptidase [Chryseobacterium sp.]TXF78848.1 S9 family peptidase [Chryseobacterium sp.]
MMGIKWKMQLKLPLGVLLLFFIGIRLSAQNKGLSAGSPFTGKTYDLAWIRPSPDSKYISFQKNYESGADTLVLVSATIPGRIIFQTAGVYPNLLHYSKNGYLFMTGSGTVKYLKLPLLRPQVWEGVTKAFFLEKDNGFVLLQKGILRIYDEEAHVVEEIKEVTTIEQREDQLFYIQKRGNSYVLVQWSSLLKQLVYTASSPKITLDFYEGQRFIVHETDPVTGEVAVNHIDIGAGTTSPLLNDKSLSFKNVAAVSESQPGNYFMTMTASAPVVQKSAVDIWYGNDNDLGKKFQNGLSLKYYLWEPAQDRVTPLEDVRFTKHVDPGNERFLLALNPSLHQDYTKERIPYELWRYDLVQGKYDLLGTTGVYCMMDPKGKYLLSYDYTDWVLFSLDTKEKRIIKADPDARPYFDEKGERIVFAGAGTINEYDIYDNTMEVIPLPEGFEASVLNGTRTRLGAESRFSTDWFDGSCPLLIKITHPETMEQAVGVYHKNKFRLLYKPSAEYVNLAAAMPDGRSFLYVKSNYNRPPVLMLNRKGNEKELFRSNPADTRSALVRMEKKIYKNSRGVPLQSLLFYPSHYDPQKKYPMITGIYELLRNQSNRYLRDGFASRIEGMNIRYYLERGYFIYLPDIVYDGRGPGRSALDCVESALDALKDMPSVDMQKVGLMGHSHGGYETNFIATQSRRFAAYVGGAGNSDLVRSYHSFNYNFVSPFYWQFEEQQYRMFKPFAEDKNLYTDNSPVYHAEKVSSPILLWAGTKDENIAWDQTMEFYLGLRRNGKKVVALFYRGDGHNLLNTANREDLFIRISDWFGYHLKGLEKDWIREGEN